MTMQLTYKQKRLAEPYLGAAAILVLTLVILFGGRSAPAARNVLEADTTEQIVLEAVLE